MLTYRGVPLPPLTAQYIEVVEGRDKIILASRAWMDAANVRMIKHQTSLATMRFTVWFVSQGRVNSDEMKEVLTEYLANAYHANTVFFYQSEDERRQSRPAHLYFHAICDLRDASNLGR